jgi:hypothetical protein
MLRRTVSLTTAQQRKKANKSSKHQCFSLKYLKTNPA